MKKILILSTTIGITALIAVPIMVGARHGVADQIAQVHREDKQADRTHNSVLASISSTIQQPSQAQINSNLIVDANGIANVSDNTSTNSSVATATTPTVVIVDSSAAKAAAQLAFPDKTIKEAELENENGTNVWEVKFTHGAKVYVDATTGLVIPKPAETESEDENEVREKTEDSHKNGSGGSHSEND